MIFSTSYIMIMQCSWPSITTLKRLEILMYVNLYHMRLYAIIWLDCRRNPAVRTTSIQLSPSDISLSKGNNTDKKKEKKRQEKETRANKKPRLSVLCFLSVCALLGWWRRCPLDKADMAYSSSQIADEIGGKPHFQPWAFSFSPLPRHNIFLLPAYFRGRSYGKARPY